VRCGGQTVVRLDEGGPGLPAGEAPREALDAIAQAGAVLVSDYGAGTTADSGVRRALENAMTRRDPVPVVWDPHPRGARPTTGCTLVTPNLAEAATALNVAASSHPADVAAALRQQWQAQAVTVTCGSAGAWLATGEVAPLYVPAPQVAAGDPCGAGDRFAAGAVAAVLDGAVPSEAVGYAVAQATAWVGAGGAAALAAQAAAGTPVTRGPVERLRPGMRDRGNPRATLVATGGCFDILHAGHVATLEAARRLGDRLVVLLNSDDSVRRLKGPGRPVQPASDRERVLRGLACVDVVVVFDEDDPRAALERLRPDIWAKGGDYSDASLPEADLVSSWGGRVVLLPYLPGRSTTSVLAAAP
jgi:rfaE bifunctional protein nucleotidyltransferase chain/domain